jgi:hypothetical protein
VGYAVVLTIEGVRNQVGYAVVLTIEGVRNQVGYAVVLTPHGCLFAFAVIKCNPLHVQNRVCVLCSLLTFLVGLFFSNAHMNRT